MKTRFFESTADFKTRVAGFPAVIYMLFQLMECLRKAAVHRVVGR